MSAGVGLEAGPGRGAGRPCPALVRAALRSVPTGESPRPGHSIPGPRVWLCVGERVRMRERVWAPGSTRPCWWDPSSSRENTLTTVPLFLLRVPMTYLVPPDSRNCTLLVIGYFIVPRLLLQSVLFLLASCSAQGTCDESCGQNAGDLSSPLHLSLGSGPRYLPSLLPHRGEGWGQS